MEAATTVAMIIVVIGAILILVEAMNPGAFIVIPGSVLVIVGIIGFIVPDFLFSLYSPLTAILLAVPVTIITILMYKKLAEPVPPATSVSDSLIGKKGKVTVKTCPDNLKGKVAIGMEVWSADSEEEIEEGTEVEVVSTEGVHITVKKA